MKHSLKESAQLTRVDGEPRAAYLHWREAQQPGEGLLLVDFLFRPYWLENAQWRHLTAIYCAGDDKLEIAVTDRALVADGTPPRQQYLDWTRQHQLLSYTVGDAIELEPLCITKPWGEEVWYTGVERRGVCTFCRNGALTPIPWLQAALPGALAGAPGEPLILLKILAPSAQAVLGDLYFELHEKKHEVYVVTHVDPQAWPDGVGYIRYGFDPQQLACYGSDSAFRAAYLSAVLAYHEQRRKLDSVAGQGTAAEHGDLEREQLLRRQMDRFTLMRPVRVGDVIQVPPLLPHALQHGVRTVEFQTPHYERQIISFAQKVLTQDHWDTQEAVPRMLLAPPAVESTVGLPGPANVDIERVVDFPDFEVLRVTIAPGSNWDFEAESSYCLLVVIRGVLTVSGGRYRPEQALLLPRSWRGQLTAPKAVTALVFLLARPRS